MAPLHCELREQGLQRLWNVKGRGREPELVACQAGHLLRSSRMVLIHHYTMGMGMGMGKLFMCLCLQRAQGVGCRGATGLHMVELLCR